MAEDGVTQSAFQLACGVGEQSELATRKVVVLGAVTAHKM